VTTHQSPVTNRQRRPLQEFLATETAGGALLLAATVAALVWANAPFGASYGDFWGAHAGRDFGAIHLDLPLAHWVNDALMAVFFFVAGLEIKREVLRGELADRRRAALPVAAAIGGMILPAAIYLAFNAGREGARGWGIPMATDIAFAVGVVTLLGRRVPLSLKVFLLALAIVDDLGAIAVIALFYSAGIAFGWLAAAAALLALMFALRRAGVRPMIVYAAAGAAVWLAVHESGVHATVAGVALGLLTPIDSLPGSAPGAKSPLALLEHALHPWTSFAIVPIFALANAGIALDAGALGDAARSPVTAGVALGLIAGKPLGILLFSWLAVRAGVASLPAGVGWPALAGVAGVAGIGFTVSLFIGDLAFGDAALVQDAKLGILAGSLVMGLAGFAALHLMSRGGGRGQAP
jgi:NhaA family Na+:H+ antiporter